MKSNLFMNFIFQSVRPFKKWVFAQFIISIIWAIDLSLRPFILKLMLDKIPEMRPQNAVHELMGLALLYIFMSLFIVIIYRVYDYVWLNLNPLLKRHIGDILMKKMMHHSQTLLQNHFAGNLGNKIKDVMSGVPDLMKLFVNNFTYQILALLIALFTFSTINYKFTLVLAVWIVIFIIGSILLSRRARLLCDQSAEVRSGVVGQIVDILSNMMNVRLFCAREYESKKLLKSLNQYVAADQKRDWYLLRMFAFQGLSFVLYQGACLIWLIYGFQKSEVTAGDFVLILSINISIIDCLWTLSEDIGKFAEIVGNISQGIRVALSPVEMEDDLLAKELQVTDGRIIFDNVKFHYKGTEAIFKNKSVTIEPHQKVGLVGYSGSGKSTFANLILRLYDIVEGSILIDGQDIRNVTQESLRKHIALIPQDPSLFHRTLLENIKYGMADASKEEVIEAAKHAYAHDFICQLPEEYDSLVGERGVKLSGGQRQRIAIARAILKDAPIIILDEATSQLDSLTESKIQASLWNLMQNKTTIVIAHRLSTLLHMDRILVFDEGKIIEDGSHQDLLIRNGLYKKMWDAQIDGFLPNRQSKDEL